MRIARLLLGLVAVSSIALTGCSKREELKLAEIKDRVITIHDYEDAYVRVKAEFLPKEMDEAGKKEFLTTMVNRDLMAVKADELGYDKDPSITQGMEAFSRMTMQIGYLRKKVGEIKVSDADIKRHYELMGSSLSFKRILCDRNEQAQEAYDALKSGLDFTSAINQYSKAEDAKDGGTVLTAPYGALLPELEAPVFGLPVGGYTEPIVTPQGWVIIQVIKIDRTAKQQAPFEEVKDRLYTQIRNQREAVAVNVFTDQLREQYGVTWNYDTLEIVFNALPPDRPVDQAQGRDQEVFPLLYFEAADLEKPAVSYPGRTITIKDFSDLYDRASFYTRPRKEMRLAGIRSFLTLNIMNDISQDAVAKSGIENDPEVKQLLDTKRDELMVSLMYEDLVNKQSVVTQDKMQEYYDLNKEGMRQPELRKFGVVIAGELEAAVRAQQELERGRPISAVALEYSTDGPSLETMGQTGLLIRGERPELDNPGFGMTRVGEISSPVQVASGWLVLKLMEISPERTYTFEEAHDRIAAALREQANDQRLKELLAKWAEEYKVVIHDDNLKKVKLPTRPGELLKERRTEKSAEAGS